MFVLGCGDLGDLGHLPAGGVHELPAVSGPTAQQAPLTTILPGAHQRVRRQFLRGQCPGHVPAHACASQHAGPGGPPAGQVEASGAGAAVQHL